MKQEKRKEKTMKQFVYFISTVCFSCMIVSCSDFLEIEPHEQIVLGNFWNEEGDVLNVIAGCYSAMQKQEWMERAIIWGEARSENLVGGERSSESANIANIAKENLNPNNSYCKWVDFYDVINRCNTIIVYAPEVAQKDPNYTQSELRATIAEASAIRDLCYFYLIRTFRNVPYTTQPFIDDTQTMDLPATPFADVLDSLTNDLESVVDDAVMYYPETKPIYQTSRITQDAIHALLCDMYLWKQDYPQAVRHADRVIQSKQRTYQEEAERVGGATSGLIDKLINGYPLISDAYVSGNAFGRAFTNIFCYGNSSESIFELYFTNDDTRRSNNGVSVMYGSSDKGNGLFCPSDLVANDISDGQFAVFTNRYDTRSYENIFRRSATQFVVAKYASQDASVNITSNPYTVSGQNSRWTQDRCHANWVIYRLTDVMLMKAEALILQINTDENGNMSDEDNLRLRTAFTLVDAVNRRSYGYSQTTSPLTYSKYSSKSAMLNLIYDERNRELMFEGKRWYDLVRRSMREGNTNYLVSQAGRKYTNNKTAAESKLSKLDAIFWPYHEDELKVNKNLTQNPAYGSDDHSLFDITQ